MNMKKTLLLLAAGLLLAAPLFAGGEPEGTTELDMPPQPRQYISPENQDGQKDELQLPFSSIVLQSENVVIVEYNLTIFDADGNVVWTQSQVEEDRVGFFGRLFGAEKPRVEVPDTLTWDGTYKDSEVGSAGEYVEDGDYTYQLFVRDDQDNVSTTPPFNVTVDNEPPTISSLGPPSFPVFSPNDDGNRDEVSIPQAGSREASWTGTITDADGNPVWRTTWESQNPDNRAADITPPSPVVWDGTYKLEGDERNGTRVPEGVYSYMLESTDRAENSAEQSADWTVTMSLRAGDVEITTTAEDAVFSPNGDGNQDTLPFSVRLAEPEGIESWEIEVRDPDRRNPVVRSERGPAPVPRRATYDGTDSEGLVLPDGTYEVVAYVQYENGTVVGSQTREFTIDTEAPQASITVDTAPEGTAVNAPLVFGGRLKDELAIEATIDPEVEWTATISAPDGRELEANLSDYGFEGPEVEVTWAGTDVDGTEAPDGEYSLQLSAQDLAGNVGRTRVVQAIKETRPTPIDLIVDSNVIQAYSGGDPQSVTIRPQYEVEDYIDDFLLEIRNADGEMVRSIYRNQPFDEFRWAGENNAGGPVPEGEYTVDFQIIYYNGNRPQITGVGPIYVDRTPPEKEEPRPPQIDMRVGPLPFSPDDDGMNDVLTIRLEAEGSFPIERWSVEISDPRDNGFKRWSGRGAPPARLRWDGRSDDGELVQSAVDYQAVFRVEDEEGQVSTVQREIPTDILVIREGDRLRIRIPSIHFAPWSADLFEISIERQDENFRILRRLATILDRYPEHDITVEGHANHILYWDEELKREEQQETLLPLSENRAQSVKEALIILGIDRDRMEVEGIGGARPLVPFSDKDHVWKNRRVEFLLER
jgi:outer membrane protein OmpA-like peptidoglycan-associated protein/flagellar hook assembly protein FlgD